MTKRNLLFQIICAIFLLGTMPAFAQYDDEPEEENGFNDANPVDAASAIRAGLGYSRIGDQNYVGFRFQPDIHLGKLGFGLDVPLLFNLNDGKIRTDEFKDGIGVLRMIRYVSYGRKKVDNFYIRVGDLTGEYLGYGLLMNNYSNSVSFEKRKLGLSLDILINKMFGLEAIYSDFNFASLNTLALRPYVKPLANSGIPILKTLDVGFNFVTDKDQTTYKDEKGNDFKYQTTKDGMTSIGFDMGVDVLNNSFIRLSVFAQYGKHLENDLLSEVTDIIVGDTTYASEYESGQGFSFGAMAKMNIVAGVLRLDTRLERLMYSDYFLPQMYDAMYELNKDRKIGSLLVAEEKQGIYGSLSATVMGKIRLTGNLLLPDNISETSPAFVRIDLDGSQISEKLIIKGSYIKGNLASLGDAFKVDENSLTQLRVAYRMKFLAAGLDYKWTYARLEDGSVKATNYITPYIGLNITF